MSNPLPPETFPQLVQLVNLTYTDGIDSIGAARVEDNGDIIVVGQDGPKILAIKIGADNKIAIRLANADKMATEQAQFSAPDISQEAIIDRLKTTGDREIGNWLNTVKDMLLTSDDISTARESLFSLWPDLETDTLESEFNQALTLSSMAGYFEAGEEID
jgi:phage gp29-like protein